MKNRCSALSVTPNITLYHVGPPLSEGPLPSLFYFALSGPDSLTLDPFNQPIQSLESEKIRIFSMTLPGHENELPAKEAMTLWAADFARGFDPVSDFLDQAEAALHFAIKEELVDLHRLGAAGLSRGAFIASHLAARDPRFKALLGFAPLTRLSKIKEFAHMEENGLANRLDLIHLSSSLADRPVRLYIGNHDTRVGTRECFDFALSLVEHKTVGNRGPNSS